MKLQLLKFIAGIALALSTAGTAAAQGGPGQGDAFTVNGTVERIIYTATAAEAQRAFQTGDTSRIRAATDPQARPFGILLQSDVTGEESLLVLDLSWLAEQDATAVPNLEVSPQLGGQTESISVLVRRQADGSFLAIQYEELAKGSMVNNTDWGIQEEWTTRDDSINARVDNVPEDDEALAQREGRKNRDDDDDDDVLVP